MIRTAVIGYGLSAKVFHLPFLRSLPGFALVAISTRQPEAASLYPHVQVYADADSLLADTDAELVVICAPNNEHARLAERALRLGKHVVVEKPLACNFAEAVSLQALALSQQKMLAVFHNRRFDDDFLALAQLLASGQLGAPRLLISRYDRCRPAVKARWKESAAPGNGILWDLAPHLLDQAIALFGRPDALTAHCRALRDTTPAEQLPGIDPHFKPGTDYFQLTLHYQATAQRAALEVQLGSSPYQYLTPLRFELHSDRGSFRCFGVDPQEALLTQGVLAFDQQAQHAQAQRHGELHTQGQNLPYQLSPGDYSQFYRQLGAQIRAGTLQPPVPVEDALLGIQLLELAEQSSRQGRTLYLP